MRPPGNRLAQPAVLERQVRRMLSDPRAESLVDELRRPVAAPAQPGGVRPDARRLPGVRRRAAPGDAHARRRCCSTACVLENRSVLDLLRADYTFVNERLARHYGMRGVYGSHFRRVPVTDPARYGLLGHASILAVTSYPNRTSPVVRGKWILENIMGTPPPPPPPGAANVLADNAPGKLASVRARLAAHRANPQCASCHKVMDPLGFALENFDAVGAWRTEDQGAAIDASDTLVDGTRVNGPIELRQALLQQPGDVRDRLHREAADLRARARPRSRRHAGRSRDRSRRRHATTTVSARSSSASPGACRSRCEKRPQS